VRPILSGICGSDLATITGRSSFYFTPLVSMPFVLGHEIVGETLDATQDVPAGTRVVISPVLNCLARGVEPWCGNCKDGDLGRCDRVTAGHVSAGLQTGYCKDTGGGWSKMLVAHRSQLHPIPDGMSDRTAVLIEPLACAVHTVTRAQVGPNADVLIIGAGSIGVLTLLSLKEAVGYPTLRGDATRHPGRGSRLNADLTPRERELMDWVQEGTSFGEIGKRLGISGRTIENQVQWLFSKLNASSWSEAVANYTASERSHSADRPVRDLPAQIGSVTVAAKYAKQRTWAEQFGATHVVDPAEALNHVRRETGAMKLRPEMGSPFLLGGVDVAIDCAGSKSSLELALRATRAGGRVVLAGIPEGSPDLTPLWFRELELVGAYTGGIERIDGEERHAFDIAIDIASRTPMLDEMVGATYPLRRWREAVDHAMSAGKLGTLKVAFDPRLD
jgi:threonine dehydrogenase-like Zn-dependent dehydrogenase/DNA-binding CsgD family transcriptional regulator